MKEYSDDIKQMLLEFNRRIIRLRKEHGYSYKKLEELTGISRSTLQRYEKNPYTDLPSNKLHALADAYNVSPSYLMGYESNELPYSKYESILPLFENAHYKLIYHSDSESFSVDNDSSSTPISVSQILELKDSTVSFFNFKLNEILKEPPTTE